MPAGPWKFPLLRRPRNFLCLRSRESCFVCGAVKVFFVCGDQSFFFFACEAVKVSLSALSFKFFVCASGVENSFGVLLFGMKCFMFTFG